MTLRSDVALVNKAICATCVIELSILGTYRADVF